MEELSLLDELLIWLGLKEAPIQKQQAETPKPEPETIPPSTEPSPIRPIQVTPPKPPPTPTSPPPTRTSAPPAPPPSEAKPIPREATSTWLEACNANCKAEQKAREKWLSDHRIGRYTHTCRAGENCISEEEFRKGMDEAFDRAIACRDECWRKYREARGE